MPRFSFRVRFHRSPVDTINISSSKWEWNIGEDSPVLLLCSYKQEEAIKDSKTWIFKSEGWASEEEASQAAKRYVDALALTLVRLRIGADFGNRAPKSAFTSSGLAMLGVQGSSRVLNDIHGLMFYESEPPPCFATMRAKGLRGVPQDHFEKIFSHALAHPRVLIDRERLSLELFNASFFQKSADSRFLVLMMAVEALLEPSPRSSAAALHVESMIVATQRSESLSPEEKESLMGALSWLRYESINQTGCRLAEKCLGGQVYMDKKAPSFFSYCYNLRSRLVHGKHPMPSRQEIDSAVAQLEVFVSDILSGELREVKLP
jgi:hypothetical protein